MFPYHLCLSPDRRLLHACDPVRRSLRLIGISIYKGKNRNFSSCHKFFNNNTYHRQHQTACQASVSLRLPLLLLLYCRLKRPFQVQVHQPLIRLAFSQFSNIRLHPLENGNSHMRQLEYHTFFMRSLEKALEPSKIAAFLRGPNTRRPLCLKYINNAAYKRIIHTYNCKINAVFLCKISQLVKFHGTEIGTHSAICPIPAFPGAQYNFVTFGLLLSFHAMACSLPPLPIISTFILPATFLHFLFTL